MPAGNNMNGAARSSYEGRRFGQNSGSGKNASRDVAKPEAKSTPKLPGRASRQLGKSPKTSPSPKGNVPPRTARQLGTPSWLKGGK